MRGSTKVFHKGLCIQLAAKLSWYTVLRGINLWISVVIPGPCHYQDTFHRLDTSEPQNRIAS